MSEIIKEKKPRKKRITKKVEMEIVEPSSLVETPKEIPIVEGKRSLNDTRLSYSSYTTIKSCEQKYWHYKINNTPVDTDYNDEKKSLILGKAFHSILEFTKHTSEGLSDAINHVKEGIEQDDMALVVAMVKVYLDFKTNHKDYKNLKPIAIELEISDKNFIGFIDVILQDVNTGVWYVGDLKTTARQSDTLKARLEMDAQLHLYSSFCDQIAEKLNLSKHAFGGALYITTNKTTTKRKSGELLSSFVTRLMDSIESRVYKVPMQEEKTKWVKEDFNTYHHRTNGLRVGSIPDKNYSQCENYFTPCQYFSKCHGHNFSEAKLEIWSSND